MRRAALAEGVAVQAGALGRGELDQHATVLERHGVEARYGHFVVMRERSAVAFAGVLPRAGDPLHRADVGDQQHVEKVGCAGAAEVCVAEAHQGGVCVVVAGAPVPAACVGVRAELDGAEGDGGAGIGVAMAAGADADIHVLGEVLTRWGVCRLKGSDSEARAEKGKAGSGGGGLEKCAASWHGGPDLSRQEVKQGSGGRRLLSRARENRGRTALSS